MMAVISHSVIPAPAGLQGDSQQTDSRLRGNDARGEQAELEFSSGGTLQLAAGWLDVNLQTSSSNSIYTQQEYCCVAPVSNLSARKAVTRTQLL
jgi:hypothetical protein